MRILKRLALSLIAIIALLAIIGLFLPREVQVARSIEIDAPAANIYPHIADLKKTIPWSPWLHHDPDTVNTFSGAEMGEGAIMEWASDHRNVGSGKMTILEARENEHLTLDLEFVGMGGATATWNLAEADGKTTATWGMVTDMGMNPMMRWMGLKMDDWVGADYQKGLENLKALVEGS